MGGGEGGVSIGERGEDWGVGGRGGEGGVGGPFPLRCVSHSGSCGVWPFLLGAWRVLRL